MTLILFISMKIILYFYTESPSANEEWTLLDCSLHFLIEIKCSSLWS